MNRCRPLAAWALAIGLYTVTATLAQTGSALPRGATARLWIFSPADSQFGFAPAAASAQDRVVVLRLP